MLSQRVYSWASLIILPIFTSTVVCSFLVGPGVLTGLYYPKECILRTSLIIMLPPFNLCSLCWVCLLVFSTTWCTDQFILSQRVYRLNISDMLPPFNLRSLCWVLFARSSFSRPTSWCTDHLQAVRVGFLPPRLCAFRSVAVAAFLRCLLLSLTARLKRNAVFLSALSVRRVLLFGFYFFLCAVLFSPHSGWVSFLPSGRTRFR